MLAPGCAPRHSATRTSRRFSRASPNFAPPSSATAQLTATVSVITSYPSSVSTSPDGGGGPAVQDVCNGQRQNQGGFLIPFADEVKEQGAPGFREWQIPQLIQDHGLHLIQLARQCAGFTPLLFPFQVVDQIDHVVEPDPFTSLDGRYPQRDRHMRFPGPRPATQNHIVGGVHEATGYQLAQVVFW